MALKIITHYFTFSYHNILNTHIIWKQSRILLILRLSHRILGVRRRIQLSLRKLQDQHPFRDPGHQIHVRIFPWMDNCLIMMMMTEQDSLENGNVTIYTIMTKRDVSNWKRR